MDDHSFAVDTSVGALRIDLFADSWTTVDFEPQRSGILGAEDIVRNEADLSAALECLNVPPREAATVASEVWGRLPAEEQEERRRLRGLNEPRREWKRRIARDEI